MPRQNNGRASFLCKRRTYFKPGTQIKAGDEICYYPEQGKYGIFRGNDWVRCWSNDLDLMRVPIPSRLFVPMIAREHGLRASQRRVSFKKKFGPPRYELYILFAS